MKLVALALVLVSLVLGVLLVTHECKNPVDRLDGGTARQWQRQASDWEVIALRFRAVAKKYRGLNERLLVELGQ